MSQVLCLAPHGRRATGTNRGWRRLLHLVAIARVWLSHGFEPFRPAVKRLGTNIRGQGDIARVHLYRWGDGGAHFHVWFMPRPLGLLEASGMMLALWEDVLPNAPDADIVAAAEKIGAVLAGRDLTQVYPYHGTPDG